MSAIPDVSWMSSCCWHYQYPLEGRYLLNFYILPLPGIPDAFNAPLLGEGQSDFPHSSVCFVTCTRKSCYSTLQWFKVAKPLVSIS